MKVASVAGVPPGISDTIDSLSLPRPVKTQAKIVYSWLDLKSVPRELRRKKYICHCINQAYYELGIDPIDPREISAIVGIETTAGCASIHNKLKYKRGIIPSPPNADPKRLLTNYMANILLLNGTLVSGAEEVLSRFLASNQWMFVNSMRDWITCFILCYLDSGGYTFDQVEIIYAIGADETKVLSMLQMMEKAVAIA